MGLGAFAGGMAQGISRGIRDVREYRRAQQEDKQFQDEETWKKELEEAYRQFAPKQAEQQSVGQVDQQQPQQQAAPTTQPATGAQPAEQQQQKKPEPPKTFDSVADAMNFATVISKINMKAGKASPMDLVKLKMMSDQFEREGMDTAIGLLHGGDVEGALKAYNASGRDRVTFKGEPVQGTYEYAGQKIPTMIATVVGADGKERQVNTAQIMTAKMGVDKQLNALMDFAKFNATADHQNKTLTEQRRHNIATEGIASRSREDGRGTVGKDYDDLARIYGPEQAAQMVGGKYGKKEVTDYQRVQALDKIQGIIDVDGGVNDKNVANINAMLRSIGEPAYERVVDTPETKNIIFPDSPATYKYVPGSRVETDTPGQGLRAPAGPAGGLGRTSDNNVGNMKNPGGKTGFQQFGSPQEALSAMDKQLIIYDGRGIDTIDKIVSTYSPPSENDTKALIDEAVRVTGFKPGQRIDLANPAARARVLAALLKQEKPASAFLKKDGQVAEAAPQKPAPSAPATAAKGGIKKGEEQPWYEKSVDVGAAVGVPIAKAGEMMGDTVTAAIELIQAATKQRVTADDIKKIKEYAREVNDPEKVANAYLGIAGTPAKNAEAHAARTSSKNLNQYFR